MTRDDALCVLTALDRFRPGYAEWRSEQANKLAAMHRTTVGEESRAMVDSIARTFLEVSTEEAAEVVEGMESGAVAVPFWGEMAALIRSRALDNRRGRRDAERYERERDPRYKCLECQDVGAVTVYNPKFVEWLRPQFEQRERDGDFPPSWYMRAAHEWYRLVREGRESAPAEVQLVCKCACSSALIFRRQGQAMVASMGSANERPQRAAYIGQWNPARQPRKTFDPQADLAAWYAAHEPQEAYEWSPLPGEYEANFGE